MPDDHVGQFASPQRLGPLLQALDMDMTEARDLCDLQPVEEPELHDWVARLRTIMRMMGVKSNVTGQ